MTRVIVAGCVKTKQRLAPGRRVAARDLYTSQLWRERRAYAEQTGHPWWILSARHGLIRPDTEISRYDTTVSDRTPGRLHVGSEVARWRLVHAYGNRDALLAGVTVEIHAGRDYVDWVKAGLEEFGAVVETPLGRLGIGQQHRWYKTGQLPLVAA